MRGGVTFGGFLPLSGSLRMRGGKVAEKSRLFDIKPFQPSC